MQHNRDNLHRGALLLMKKEGLSVDEAYRRLNQFRLGVVIGPDAARSPSGQACLLSVINTAVRACPGGVFIEPWAYDHPLQTQMGVSGSLAEAVVGLGGQLAAIPAQVPTILIGDCVPPVADGLVLRATFGFGSGGIVTDGDDFRLPEDSNFPPAAVFAGALAVAECFAHLLGERIAAGYTSAGLSLLDPKQDWRTASPTGTLYLPDSLWLLGLGHLGQAYAWTLASLPYPEGKKPVVYLQDYDNAGQANISTSVLTHTGNLGQLKTKIVADWLEARGFIVRRVERAFSSDLKVLPTEPRILLAGLHDQQTRRLLEEPGFPLVVDAGLGATAHDYDGFIVQTFTGTSRAKTAFPDSEREESAEARVENNLHSYESLGLDRCGMLQVASTAVGVPFVGVAVAGLVLGQVLRAIAGEPLYDTIAGNLGALGVVSSSQGASTIRNPGYISPDAH